MDIHGQIRTRISRLNKVLILWKTVSEYLTNALLHFLEGYK